MIRLTLLIGLNLLSSLSHAQKNEINGCDVLKAFVNDSIAKQFLRLDKHRLSDTLFVVDTSYQIEDCDAFLTGYNRFVVMERATKLRNKIWGGYIDDEYQKWTNHIWLTSIKAEKGIYTISFFWKYTNGGITIKYKLQQGNLVRTEWHGGYF